MATSCAPTGTRSRILRVVLVLGTIGLLTTSLGVGVVSADGGRGQRVATFTK